MKLKISFISDLHSKHFPWEMKIFEQGKLTELYSSDIVVFCGDMSSRGYKHEIENFLAWFSDVAPNAKKIFIAGNHDFFFDAAKEEVKKVLENYPDLVYLEDSSFEYMGLKFWGSPITPWFHDWAFNRWEDEIGQYWTIIPEDIDVLITHGPAFGIGDLLHPQFRRYNEKNNVGCPLLLREIQNRIKPAIHAFGHIHEAYGIYSKIEDAKSQTLYINASCLNQDYQAINPPITVEIDTETKETKVI